VNYLISTATLHEIISDYAPKSETLIRVGIVGSYARETAHANSDIDLVFDTGGKLVDEAIISAGTGIRSVLRDQFNTKTDIINYNTILTRLNNNNDESPITIQGYKLMLADLKWIWSKKAAKPHSADDLHGKLTHTSRSHEQFPKQ